MDTHHTSGLTSQFKFEFIKQITNNFSEDRIIGSGAYGVVYKGVLDNGEDIAVKKLIYMPPNHDSEKQFHNECTNLMRVKHQNIVRLVGYCHETRRQCVEYDGNYVFAEENERALCFEYLEGGSLEKYVSDKPCRLDWDICYKIIKGVCEGLNHLHNGCAYLIFHLDLKPANILLDKSMMPKIGDFGLSRLFSSTETCTTSTPLGTMGYTPPEYVDKQEISPKYDVFSLGVMIIHMMAGRTHYYDHVHTPSKIIELVCENWNKRLQATMCSDASQEVKTCIEIALRCVKSDRHERPTISQIIDDLNRIGIAKLPFKPQATNLQSREALDSNQYINSVSSDEVEGNDRPMQDPMDYVHGSNESIMRDLASGATEGYASRVISRPRDVAQGTEVNFLGDGHRRRNHHIRTRSLGSSVASEISDLKDVGEHSGRYGVRDPENGKKKSIFAGSTVYLAAANEETTRRLIGIKKPVGVKDIETTCGLFTMEAVGDTEATIKSLLGKLGGLLAEEEYLLIGGVLGDIQFINDELTSMQAFLSNRGDDLTKYWMKQVGDVSKDIEDCVDQFPFAHGIRPDPRDNGLLSKMQTWYLHRRVAAQISDLKKRAKNVGKYRRKYLVHHPENGKKKSILAGSTGYLAAENQETTRRLNSIKKPVGVKDIEKLEKWISSEDNKMKLGVLSIVGFGGVGKTTIAQALYRKYGGQFQHRAVVTVSQNSDPEAILRNVLSQVKPQANSEEVQAEYSAGTSLLGSIWSRIISPVEEKNEGLQVELKNYLKNRYLLLIDDVWSSSTWQSIKKYFPENNNGSRIIATTRFQAVATTCFAHQDNDYIHIVNFLSNDEPRDLFQKSLLECIHTAESRQSWRKIPERVWGMCGGMPLAIVTMAGLVASNMLATENEWTAVCNSLFPEPEKCRKPEDFTRIINFCYNDLPGDVKTCTLYLSIFPKGRKISSKRLIRRWIAEGFLTEKLGLSVEDAAETCFNQLIERKIVRPVEYSSNGRVKSCHVHDMVLEYIISKAAEENFVTVVGGYWSMKKQSKVRRLSLHRTDSKHARKADSMNLSHVRSLTVFGSLDQLHFKSFKTGILRVLDLEGCIGFNANHFSVTDICEMTLLKYLSLRGTNISKLPSKIGKLKYLETLDIRQTDIEELPKSIIQLERISNILGGDKRSRKTLKLPKDIKRSMKGLRILSGIEIVKGSTAASDLSYFTSLRKLAIYKLNKGDQNQMFEDLRSSIMYLGGYCLQSLAIDDESSQFFEMLDYMPTYPRYLKTLMLSGKLLKIPQWLPSLSELIKLNLSVTVLRTDNLMLLSQLESLFSLTFSISAANQDPDIAGILKINKAYSGGEIVLPSKGFGKLKLLCIVIPLLPALNFSKNGTPVLEKVELRFKSFEGLRGIEKVESLHDVLITVDDKPDESTKSILEDLNKSSSGKHAGQYTLIVREYYG